MMPRRVLPALLGAAALIAVLVVAGGSATAAGAPGRSCGSFRSQADAQESFIAAGGGPDRDAGRLDPDHDGVACETLGAPYQGFATIGYNRRGQFFFGTATMPPGADPTAEAPCLAGNTHFPDGAREVQIYRVTPAGPRPLLGRKIGAEARPGSARLLWKVKRSHILAATYYAEFDERVRLSPNGRNECPAFVSRPVRLPAMPGGA